MTFNQRLSRVMWQVRCAWADWQAERDLQRLRQAKLQMAAPPSMLENETITIWGFLLAIVLSFAVGYISRDDRAIEERAALLRHATLVPECTPPAAPAPAPVCQVVETADHCQKCHANWLNYGVLDKRLGR